MPFLSETFDPEHEPLSILLYGEMGTGKSTLAASAPQPGYLLAFDDHVAPYARGQWWIEPALWDRSQKPQQRWQLLRQELQRLQTGRIGDTELRTLVLDSTTSLARAALEYAMALNPQRGLDGGPIWNVHRAMAKNLVDEVINYVLTFPGVRIVIAHVDVLKHEITGEIQGIVSLPGKLSTEAPSRFGEVWLATATRTKDGMRYEVHFEPQGWFKARSCLRGLRGPSVPASAPNNWNAVMNALVGTANAQKGDAK